METGAFCGLPLSSGPLNIKGPRWIDLSLPYAKEAGAETYTSSTSQRRPFVANGR